MNNDTTFELVEMLFKLSRIMKEQMSFTNKLTHLSVLQIQTLVYIQKNKNTTMGGIADYFRIELPSATSLINKLCEQKLVLRVEDASDRRLVRITLTGEGKTLFEQAMKERRKKLEKILSYLSENQKTELGTILNTLNTRLQN